MSDAERRAKTWKQAAKHWFHLSKRRRIHVERLEAAHHATYVELHAAESRAEAAEAEIEQIKDRLTSYDAHVQILELEHRAEAAEKRVAELESELKNAKEESSTWFGAYNHCLRTISAMAEELGWALPEGLKKFIGSLPLPPDLPMVKGHDD